MEYLDTSIGTMNGYRMNSTDLQFLVYGGYPFATSYAMDLREYDMIVKRLIARTFYDGMEIPFWVETAYRRLDGLNRKWSVTFKHI